VHPSFFRRIGYRLNNKTGGLSEYGVTLLPVPSPCSENSAQNKRAVKVILLQRLLWPERFEFPAFCFVIWIAVPIIFEISLKRRKGFAVTEREEFH
jgi:hypothetical protein